ncbi:MAG: VOC family protein [bacterium]|nr:VOC family protein [bacterium]
MPDGYHTVTPYLQVEILRQPDGAIMHAEVQVGDSKIMIGQARGESKAMPATLYVYVQDTDATYRRGLAAGATSEMEPSDQFYGDRNAGLKDECGNRWWIATHIEDLRPEELAKRAAEHYQQR